MLKDIVLASSLRVESSMRREQVSLGANGIGFLHDERIGVGEIVAFHLVLLPQHEAVLGYARVRQSRRIADRSILGVEFIDLGDDHQRRLSRHMLKAQISSKPQRD
ncbi:MAG: PilZ domain-containing protein [Gammaproteobacteria bacterium]|nr:PilZ domain-containing protein [Gammaproteobacteria bacterium]